MFELLSFVVPVIAVGSLTAALVVPFRDARRGDRATLAAGSPLVPRHGAAEVFDDKASDGNAGASVESGSLPVQRKPNAYAALRAIEARLSRAFGAARALRERAPSKRDDGASPSVDGEATPFAEYVAALVRYDGDLAIGAAASVVPEPDGAAELPSDVRIEPASEIELDAASDAVVPNVDDRVAEDLATTATVRIDIPPPLTRMRLRPERGAQWPTLLPIPHVGLTREARHALLRDLTRACDATCEPALAAAFGEEDAAGRMLVLEAIARLDGSRAKAILSDAMRGGTDEERVLTIDLFVRRGDRDSIEAALDDRVDAIAARAALAYVGTNERAAFEHVLARLDGTRRAAVLALLAGVLV